MRKPKMFGLCWLLIILASAHQSNGEGTFEDADKANDVVSSSANQQYDLRHTIPGEPGVDYPVYHALPKTSFECTGRHEGYYADVETRCQGFRICAHTARSKHGFGFLCPNGTLFSQRHFVCDWYRNVNCDDSERYFSKNNANRVGSSYDMMETVRQMMEYPMKTITRALQQQSSSSSATNLHAGVVKRPNAGSEAQTVVEIAKGTKSESKSTTAARVPVTYGASGGTRKTAITRDQVESAYNYAQGQTTGTGDNLDETIVKNETVITHEKSTASGTSIGGDDSNLRQGNDDDDDVFVNSLGELSTDPGVNFIRTNAHIIAEPHRVLRKKMNFAEKVNAGLNDLVELPTDETLAPDYVKQLRQKTDGHHAETSADSSYAQSDMELAAHINGLLDEIATDVDPKQSGYQIAKPSQNSFKFLSRGFSAQSSSKTSEKTEGPYQYNKPKQTASTIRFSPNEIPLATNKATTNKKTQNTFTAIIDDDARAFAFEVKTTPAPPAQSYLNIDESYLLHPSLPPFEEEPILNDKTETSTHSTTLEPDQYNVEPLNIRVIESNVEDATTATEQALALDTTITTAVPVDETEASTKLNPTTETSIDTELVAEQDDEELQTELDAEKVDVNQRANNLLLAGVKLTEQQPKTDTTTTTQPPPVQENETALISPAPTEATSPIDAEASTNRSAMSTSTETVTEVSSTQERIKSFRRFATLNRATATKPLYYGKRSSARSSATTSASTAAAGSTTSTTKPSTTTKSYLKRVAASRLRLSRLTMARGTVSTSTTKAPTERPTRSTTITTTTTTATTSSRASDEEKGKRLSIRDLDKETGTHGSEAKASVDSHVAAASNGVATWETVRNNLQRYQVNRKRSGNTGYSYSTTTQTTTTATPATTTTRSSSRRSTRTPATVSSRTVTSNRGRNRYSNFRVQTSSTTTTSTTSRPHGRQQNRKHRQQQQQQHNTQAVSQTTYSHIHHTSNSPHTSTILNSVSSPTNAGSDYSVKPFEDTVKSTPVRSKTATTGSPAPTSHISSSTTSISATSTSLPPPSTGSYLSFDKLTRAIVDESVLQNFRSSQTGRTSTSFSSSTSSSSATGRSAGSSTGYGYSKTPVSNAPIKSSTLTESTSPPTPRIVIARAEGQRIEPNSVTSIISSLVGQQQPAKPSASSSYVPLDNFLTKKFGNVGATVSYTEQQQREQELQRQQQQRQQELQRQQQQQQQQQQENIRQQQQRQQEELRRQQEQQRRQQEQQRQEDQRRQQEQLRLQQQQQQQQQQQLQQQQQQQQQQQLNFITQQHQTKPVQTQPEQQQWSIFTHQQHLQQQLQQQPQQQQQQQITQTHYSTQSQQQQQQPQPYYLQQQQLLKQQQQQPQQQQQQHPQQRPQQQASFNGQNIYANYQQQQQQQLQQFPTIATQQTATTTTQQTQNQTPFVNNIPLNSVSRDSQSPYLNVQLPTLPNGLIPAATTQVAQKRSDISAEQLELTSGNDNHGSLYGKAGRSSYDVALGSIGRLPNDITHLLRRLRRY